MRWAWWTRGVAVAWALTVGAAACDSGADGDVDAPPTEDTAEDAAADDAGADAAPDEGPGETLDGGDLSPPADGWEPGGPGLGVDYGANVSATSPRYDPDAADWLAVGFPSDRWRTDEGGLDLSAFPSTGAQLLEDYLAYGEEALDGFGLNGAVYVPFAGAIDPESLPTPEGTLDPLAAVQLVNVSADSPAYGERRPLLFRWWEDGLDVYWSPQTLAMRPVYGWPLSEGDVWCAIVTRAVRGADGGFLAVPEVFTERFETAEELAPLRAWLPEASLHRDDLAFATCFTTQHATAELRAVREHLDTVEPPVVDEALQPQDWAEVHGTYTAPNFQAGIKPYETDGELQLDDRTGQPLVQSLETIRYLLLIPHDRQMPDAGWPTVLYAHGTGGDYESCRSTGEDLRRRGMAVLCMDQPLHGLRDEGLGLSETELVLFSFNIINPRAGRTSFRQAAIDHLVMARMVGAGRFDLDASETQHGEAIRLDPSRLGFFGHSHGGLSGALALGVDPMVDVAVLSGAAGVLVETVLRRKDPADIALLASGLLDVLPEQLDTFHPTMTLVQTLVDATDPVNYAPYWLRPQSIDGVPKHVFVTEGTEDHASPSVGTDALAAAAGLPLRTPRAKRSPAHDLKGLPPLQLPTSLELVGAGGELRTGGLVQWQGGSHWVAFEEPEAEALWRTFMESWAYGDAPILGLGDQAVPTPAAIAGADTCEGVPVVDAATVDLPVVLTGDTTLAQDDLALVDPACGGGDAGAGSRDMVFGFRADLPGEYRVLLDLPPSFDPDEPRPGPTLLWVFETCGAPSVTCLERDDDVVWVDMDAGETVYIAVDGTAAGDQGAFELEIRRTCDAPADLCDGRECGVPLGGCSSCGSCGAGEACSADGQCVAALPGDTCEVALPLAAGETVTGSTADYSNDYGLNPGDCGGDLFFGNNSHDVVYEVTADTAGPWEFTLEGAVDDVLYVLTSCELGTDSCVAASRSWRSGERVLVDMGVGETVYLVVDGAFNYTRLWGGYTLSAGQCEPQCDGKTCGSDGCGGVCGECTDVEQCAQSTECPTFPMVCASEAFCGEAHPGDLCGNALAVGAMPWSDSGTTFDKFNDFSFPNGACPGSNAGRGAASPDVVYQWSVAEAGRYRVEIDTDYDSSLYVAGSCADVGGTCLAADDDAGANKDESLWLDLDGGEELFVFVDGRGNFTPLGGTYTLDIAKCTPSCEGKLCGSDGCGGTCGGCPQGSVCAGGECKLASGQGCDGARVVNTVPYSDDSNTGSYADTGGSACDDSEPPAGAGAPDATYVYTAKTSGWRTFRLEKTGSWDATLTVTSGCGEGAACVGWTEGDSAIVGAVKGGPQVDLEVAEGETYHLRIDRLTGTGTGGYRLIVEDTCWPSCDGKACGGDGCGGSCGACGVPADVCSPDGQCVDPADDAGATCASAKPVGALPFAAEGDTSGQRNHHHFAWGQCPGWVTKGQGSRDEVWSFTAPEAGTFEASVTPTDGWDAALYAVSDCDAIASTCMAADDGQLSESVTLTLDAGETVYLVVDGEDNVADDSGEYTLTVGAAE